MAENKGLAQRLRPSLFRELLGQELTAEALSVAVSSGRLAQAFLFSGPRGVGKTSAARILARALLCEKLEADGEPCNRCKICQSVLANASVDIYEIDAASNRGIDSIRELRKNAKYVPSRAARKVYIVDEVHMLTMESFNALLKIIEEPPPHVTFIFATTEVQKVPATVISRCQRYQFSRLSTDKISECLAKIAQQEGAHLSKQSLWALAEHARGSMRDALVGLDQIWAFAGKEAQEDKVMQMLGLLTRDMVWQILEAILKQQPAEALMALDEISKIGGSLSTLLGQLIAEVSGLNLLLALQKDASVTEASQTEIFRSTRISNEARDFATSSNQPLSADVLQQLFYVLLEAESQMRQSRFEKTCLEMAILKGCQLKSLIGVGWLLEKARTAVKAHELTAKVPTESPTGLTHTSKTDPTKHKVPETNTTATATMTDKATRVATDNIPANIPANSTEVKLPPTPTFVARTENNPALTKGIPNAATVPTIEPIKLPCQNQLWLDLAGLAEQHNQALGMLVRHSEVVSFGADIVAVIPPVTPSISAEQRATLQQLAQKIWGDLPAINFSEGTPHQPHSLAGLKIQQYAQHKKNLEHDALKDPLVQSAKTYFPAHQVLKVEAKKESEAGQSHKLTDFLPNSSPPNSSPPVAKPASQASKPASQAS